MLGTLLWAVFAVIASMLTLPLELPRKAVAVALLASLLTLIFCLAAFARDPDGRYADSPLHAWFESLASKGGGPCCSQSDGATVEDPDWETVGNNPFVHFRVRLEGQWVDVPDDRVITGPNRSGQTMVWPVRYNDNLSRSVRFEIRCFMPGSMG